MNPYSLSYKENAVGTNKTTLLTVADAAEKLGINTWNVEYLHQSGKLAGAKVGNNIIFTEKTIQAYQDGRQVDAPQLYSTSDVATMNGCDKRTVLKYIKEQGLGTLLGNVGGRGVYVLTQAEVDKLRLSPKPAFADRIYKKDGRFYVKGVRGLDGDDWSSTRRRDAAVRARQAGQIRYHKGEIHHVNSQRRHWPVRCELLEDVSQADLSVQVSCTFKTQTWTERVPVSRLKGLIQTADGWTAGAPPTISPDYQVRVEIDGSSKDGTIIRRDLATGKVQVRTDDGQEVDCSTDCIRFWKST